MVARLVLVLCGAALLAEANVSAPPAQAAPPAVPGLKRELSQPAGTTPINYSKIYCPKYAPFFGFIGAACALIFGNMGAAYGTWKAAVGVAMLSRLPNAKVSPEMVIKSMLPVIIAGVCGIFGLIIAIIICNTISSSSYSLFNGYAHFGAGLAAGFSNLASGLSIGMCGDIGVRDSARQPKLYIGMVMIWSFGSALGLYGLIVGLIVATKSSNEICALTGSY